MLALEPNKPCLHFMLSLSFNCSEVTANNVPFSEFCGLNASECKNECNLKFVLYVSGVCEKEVEICL